MKINSPSGKKTSLKCKFAFKSSRHSQTRWGMTHRSKLRLTNKSTMTIRVSLRRPMWAYRPLLPDLPNKSYSCKLREKWVESIPWEWSEANLVERQASILAGRESRAPAVHWAQDHTQRTTILTWEITTLTLRTRSLMKKLKNFWWKIKFEIIFD